MIILIIVNGLLFWPKFNCNVNRQIIVLILDNYLNLFKYIYIDFEIDKFSDDFTL